MAAKSVSFEVDKIDDVQITEEDIIQRHKKERKDLLGEVQKLKKSVSKGDKKKKKESLEKIAVLEDEQTQRHEDELKEFLENQQTMEDLSEDMSALNSEVQESEVPPSTEQEHQVKRPSKAQKRREKKSQEHRDREERIVEQASINLTGPRNLESQAIKALLAKKGLQIHQIQSDGNCLYSAINHQLHARNIESSNEKLREQTASYIRGHADDFMPFLTHTDTGNSYTEGEFENYCHDLEFTAAWGGHLELRALSQALRIPLEVIQAEGPPIIMGDEYMDQLHIILTYHRHAFGLGEHYNSTSTKMQDSDEAVS